MNGCRNQTSLSFAEWYQLERLLVAISLFHPGDRHTLRQTEDLNDYECDMWMPIPSFNEILEANRDVLERIKQKGD